MSEDSRTGTRLSAAGVYTTIAPERVLEVDRGDDPSEVLHEKKRWVAARKLFDAAERAGHVFPIFLSSSRACGDLLFWAHLRGIEVTEDGTYFTFSHLQGLRDCATQDLMLLNERRNIAEGFIRPYALVSTPDFLDTRCMDPYERAELASADESDADTEELEGEAVACETSARRAAPGESPSPESGDAPLTLFTWGYSGWGSSVPQWLDATAAAERARGYEPPVFVDVRFSRSVRAPGFRDHAFERAVPEGRYVWMKGLGNEGIASGGLKIHKPETAELLLDLAIREKEQRRRVIFFCSCASPARCHRNQVRDLLLRAAKRRRLPLQVVEWPGGEPAPAHALTLEISAPLMTQVLNGRSGIPIDESLALKTAALPWGSYVELTDGVRRATVSVGPPQASAGGWAWPILVEDVEEGDEIEMLADGMEEFRAEYNYNVFRYEP